MRESRERGAVIVEATISLTVFIFLMFTLLSIVNIYYIQAKIGIALNGAAKEVSQYSYIYYKLGIPGMEQEISNGTEGSYSMGRATIEGLSAMIGAFEGAQEGIGTGDFSQVYDSISEGAAAGEELISMYADAITDDPKAFIAGMAQLAANQGVEWAKARLGQAIAKAFMKKNLKANSSDDPDSFLKRYHVVDGLNGLDFGGSVLMAGGNSNEILFVCTYDVEVIKLLNIDFKFTFTQFAKTVSWGTGVSAK